MEKIKSLAMMKMEKNFIAHMEKGYARQPYEHYSLDYLINRMVDEGVELMDAIDLKDVEKAKDECADISNIIDYIFERLSHGKVS